MMQVLQIEKANRPGDVLDLKPKLPRVDAIEFDCPPVRSSMDMPEFRWEVWHVQGKDRLHVA